MQRRADARVGLCTGDDEPPDSEARQHRLERGVLEGVAVVLLNKRLAVIRRQLSDDLPAVAPARELLVGVLHPDHRDPFPPRLLDKADDIRDDRVAPVRPVDDPVLHVNDEEGGVRSVAERGHGIPCSCRVRIWFSRFVRNQADSLRGSPTPKASTLRTSIRR